MNPSSAYYEHNLQRYIERTRGQIDAAAIEAFAARLPAGGRIFDAGCGSGRDLRVFNRLGFQVEGCDASAAMVDAARAYSGCKVWQADLMLLSLQKEAYDGIWAHRSLIHFAPNGCQRVMGSFFSALKSGGHLFVSIEEGEGEIEDRTDDPQGPARKIHRYRSDDFASLVRQSGFQIVLQGHDVKTPHRLAFIARRV